MSSFTDIFTDLVSSKSKRQKMYEQGALDESDLSEEEKKKFKKKKKKKPIMNNNSSTTKESSGSLLKAITGK